MKLPEAQGKRLLKLYLTGEPGGGPWSTMKVLERKGLLTLGHHIEVTPKGRQWCDDNHLSY